MSDTGGGQLSGPDLGAAGVALSELRDGAMLLGHFGGESVLLVRKGAHVYGMGAKCTHYGGPLDQGLFDGSTVHCPWHRACFRPETGEAVHAPPSTLSPLIRLSSVEAASSSRVFDQRLPPLPHSPPDRLPSSLLEAGRRDLRPPRCCDAKDTDSRSP